MQDEDVKKYIEISKTISNLERRKKGIRDELYSNNLFVHPCYSLGIISATAMRPDVFVLKLFEFEKVLQDRIDRCKMRQRIFNHPELTYKRYLSLTDEERTQIKDDCFQAETYTAFHCGYEPPQEVIELTGDNKANLQILADMFK